jgi:hypothetical protein
MAWFLTELLLYKDNFSYSMKFSLNNHNTQYVACLIVCIIGLFSCKKEEYIVNQSKTAEVNVKMINAALSSRVDFYLNNQKINKEIASFGEITDAIIESGLKSTSIIKDGIADVNTSFQYIPSFSYTSFYVEDRVGKGELLTFEDNLGAVPEGKARVRFINLSPYFSNAINVNINSTQLIVNSLNFKEASLYFTIDTAAKIDISVIGTNLSKTLQNNELISGRVYTIWLSGANNSSLNINKITYN